MDLRKFIRLKARPLMKAAFTCNEGSTRLHKDLETLHENVRMLDQNMGVLKEEIRAQRDIPWDPTSGKLPCSRSNVEKRPQCSFQSRGATKSRCSPQVTQERQPQEVAMEKKLTLGHCQPTQKPKSNSVVKGPKRKNGPAKATNSR